MISNDLIVAIHKEGIRQYPNEACGVVICKGKKSIAIPCKNIAGNPRTHFVMDVNDHARAADEGEIIGIWHTHVEIPPRPSEADRVGCENSEVPWYIVSVFKNEDVFSFSDMTTIEPTGFEMGYLERPYAFGVLDCLSLVRDYYKREFNIEIMDGPRLQNFWKDGNNYFGEGWKERGFKQLIDQEPQAGDLFLIQTDDSGNPNHIAVYIGNEMILHHCHGRLSRRDIYGGYWQKHTTHHLRHETKC